MRTRRSGLTLLEVLVILATGFLLLALLLPALQAAREAARRTRCTENLGRLARALHAYHATWQTLPAGGRWMPLSESTDATVAMGFGLLPPASLLRHRGVHDAINFDRNPFDRANSTILAARIPSLWCPSDPAVGRASMLPSPPLRGRSAGTGPRRVTHSSYAGVAGPWPSRFYPTRPSSSMARGTAEGVFYCFSSTHFGEIRDGLSETLLLGEQAHVFLGEPDRPSWRWWATGSYGDTLITTEFPPNPHRLPGGVAPEAFLHSASSPHPVGANFAMADGSVRVIRDSVDSWPLRRDGGGPIGLRRRLVGPDPFWDTIHELEPGFEPGIYQALSTRRGGERVAPDSY